MVVPGMSGCVAMLMGAMPRLFMAVAQALGSDMGIGMELGSMVMFRIASGRNNKEQVELVFQWLGSWIRSFCNLRISQLSRNTIKSANATRKKQKHHDHKGISQDEGWCSSESPDVLQYWVRVITIFLSQASSFSLLWSASPSEPHVQAGRCGDEAATVTLLSLWQQCCLQFLLRG